ncbi:MAG: nucleotidyltransferase domain-containing protein [Firmicutes bacterium]|nr:nucleotidyltransferase domain-containing protein [Bacillota bacterium]
MPKKSTGSVRIFYPPFSRQELTDLLRRRLPELHGKLPLVKVVLFGSYARGNYTVASDVDLLVVYSGPPRPDAFALVKTCLAVPRLEPHVYAEEEYRRRAQVLSRMTEGGLSLWPPSA